MKAKGERKAKWAMLLLLLLALVASANLLENTARMFDGLPMLQSYAVPGQDANGRAILTYYHTDGERTVVYRPARPYAMRVYRYRGHGFKPSHWMLTYWSDGSQSRQQIHYRNP